MKPPAYTKTGEPYVNNPGYRGHLLWNPDDLLTLTNFAVRRGWKVGTHAIGDRAVRTLLVHQSS
jgi:predicted amidohydrolase YtcJ